MDEFTVQTNSHTEFVNIDSKIQEVIEEQEIAEGLCHLLCFLRRSSFWEPPRQLERLFLFNVFCFTLFHSCFEQLDTHSKRTLQLLRY